MQEEGSLFRKIDAVTIPMPDLEAGLRFYGGALGHLVRWRNEGIGQAALSLPERHGDSSCYAPPVQA